MRVIIAFGTILFAALGAMGQSLTFEDLFNLQKNDLNKAKGYFNYKGWRWSGTEKDCSGCLQQNGYDLAYDKTTWTNNNESFQLLQSAGHPNAVFYYPGQNGYSAIEREAKGVLTSSGGGTGDDRIWSSYKGNGLLFTLNAKKSRSSYSEQTSYSIAIVNEADISSRIAKLCNSCKGKGQIVEKEKCSQCLGNTDLVCSSCNGSGNSSRKVKKVCSACNGSKLKASGQSSSTNTAIVHNQQEEVLDEPDFFTIVEDMPSYPGGNAAMLQYIAQSVVYPPKAREDGITGVVYVSYIVDKNGKVRNGKVVRGANALLDKEAVRVVNTLEGYTPGRQGGKPVNVQFTIPIRFIIN